jgi:hypothetical protein
MYEYGGKPENENELYTKKEAFIFHSHLFILRACFPLLCVLCCCSLLYFGYVMGMGNFFLSVHQSFFFSCLEISVNRPTLMKQKEDTIFVYGLLK